MTIEDRMYNEFMSLTKLERKEIIRQSKIIINFFNSNLKENKLNVSGNENIVCKVMIYGYDEIIKSLSITLKSYSHLDDEEIYSKFNGIVYNRNEKKQLIKI